MKFSFISPSTKAAQLVLTPVYKNQKNPMPHVTGDAGELVFAITQSELQLFYGLGEEKKAVAFSIASACASALRYAQDKKYTRINLQLPAKIFSDNNTKHVGETVARLIAVATYRFHDYHTDAERVTTPLEEIIFSGVPAGKQKMFLAGVHDGELIARATNAARDLGNHSPLHMHPEKLAAEAVRLSKGIAKLSTKIFHKKEIVAHKMGGLLGVAAGSTQPPTFIIMEYRGGAATTAPVVLVGKGVTFDTGGISIKPADKMDEMKFDMMGGATVIGTVLAAALLKLPINVVGLVPATENMPSGSAIRPGDILHMHSGKTVEVLNTDAEGRLILADGLSYGAQHYKPKCMIDIATLTGACVVALGESRAGLWSTDEKLQKRLSAAAEHAGEHVWPMPLGEDYSSQVKSEVADLKNITERWGSANTAAAFLQEFVAEKIAWAHLDIGGVAYSAKLHPTRTHGATGWGVALLVDMLRQLKVQ